jgi:hypothetical protein
MMIKKRRKQYKSHFVTLGVNKQRIYRADARKSVDKEKYLRTDEMGLYKTNQCKYSVDMLHGCIHVGVELYKRRFATIKSEDEDL